jgi:hypothetical protein
MSAKQLAFRSVDEQIEPGAGNSHTPVGMPDCLESWKDIAAYLRRDIRTAQRWEKTAGLPIHRVHDSKSGSVFAFKSEFDSWRRLRAVKIARDSRPVVQIFPEAKGTIPVKAAPGPRRMWIILLLIGLLAGAAAGKIVSYIFDSITSSNPKAVSSSQHYPTRHAALKPPKNSS